MQPTISPEQASAIVEQCPVPLLVLDSKGEVKGYNHSFAALVGKRLASGLVGRSYATLANHPLRALTGPETLVAWTDRNGEQRHFDIQRIELADHERLEVRFFNDISRQVRLERSQEELNEQLRRHTLTDAVTGLLNQRGLMLALEPQVARSRRYNSPMAVIMLDVHAERVEHDRLRLRVAQLLKDQLRWADLVGCSEQREFILVLPETTEPAAHQLADKLRNQLAELGDKAFDGCQLWARCGIAGWRKSDSAASLLKRAAMSLAEARAPQADHAAAL